MSNVFEGLGTVEKVRGLMAAHNLSMADVAKELNVSLGTVSNRFALNDWSVAEIKALAEKFGVEITDLI